jgi:hypothetical protein
VPKQYSHTTTPVSFTVGTRPPTQIMLRHQHHRRVWPLSTKRPRHGHPSGLEESGEDGVQTAAGIAAAVILGQIGKVTEKAKQGLTAVRPSTVASRWVCHAYSRDFPSLEDNLSPTFIDTYRATHDPKATLTPQGAFKGATISGWPARARKQRLEVIAAGLEERHA